MTLKQTLSFCSQDEKEESASAGPCLGAHVEAWDGEGRIDWYVSQSKHMALNPMGCVSLLQGHWVPSTPCFLLQDILRELPSFSTIFKNLV